MITINSRKLLKLMRKVNGVEVKANGTCHGSRPLATLKREQEFLDHFGEKVELKKHMFGRLCFGFVFLPRNKMQAKQWGVLEEDE